MKKLIAIIPAMMLTLGLFAQETIVNDKDASIRKLSGFHGVKVSGSIDLYIAQGQDDAVAVSAPSEEIKEDIITEVKNGILYIHPRDNNNWWKREWNSFGKKIRAYVSAKELDYINSSGSGNVFGTGEIKADKLELILSGSGNLESAIKTGELSVNQSGSSNIRLRGSAAHSSFNMSGSGNIYSYDLVTDYSEIRISGSGNVELTTNKEISAHISGSGNIRLKGDADIRDISTSGSGRIKRV